MRLFRRRRPERWAHFRLRNLDGTTDRPRLVGPADTFTVGNGGHDYLRVVQEDGVWVLEQLQPIVQISTADLRLWADARERRACGRFGAVAAGCHDPDPCVDCPGRPQ